MGLDAVVRCRCWEEGKVSSPPPHREHVGVDEEDCLRLTLPWQENREKHEQFDHWLAHCCPHPSMEYASEWISNWGGLRAFQEKVADFGADQFPTLTSVLPRANGGLVTSELSRLALDELEAFGRRDFGSQVVIVDTATGEMLHSYIETYGGVFILHPGNWEAGVDPSGFFIRGPKGFYAWLAKHSYRKGGPKQTVKKLEGGLTVSTPSRGIGNSIRSWLTSVVNRAGKHERFRSMRFRQEQLGIDRFCLTDQRTGASLVSSIGVSKPVPWPDGRMQNESGQVNSVYPSLLSVECRQRGRGDFDYIIRSLRKVFQASVETGNPVQWR